MAGRGRGEGGRQDSPVSAQGWCGDRCGADGAVGTSGSGRNQGLRSFSHLFLSSLNTNSFQV